AKWAEITSAGTFPTRDNKECCSTEWVSTGEGAICTVTCGIWMRETKRSGRSKRARSIAKQKREGNPRATCLNIQPQNVRIALLASFQQEVEKRQVCPVSNAIGARLW